MKVGAITAPYDSGAYGLRMGRGPEALFRECLEPLLRRCGVEFERHDLRVTATHPAEIATAFECCRMIANDLRRLIEEDVFPVVLSGNCIAAVGAVAGCGSLRAGAVWFDAHGEGMTPDTTRSGFLDGMGISVLTGQCWGNLAGTIPGFVPLRGEDLILAGARDLELEEEFLLKRVGVVRAKDAGELQVSLRSLRDRKDGVYVHLDLDVLDPGTATANQWTPPGGMRTEALVEAFAAIAQAIPILGVGIGSYDPDCDADRRALTVASKALEVIFTA